MPSSKKQKSFKKKKLCLLNVLQTEKKKTMLFGDYVGNNAISLCVLRISERVTLLV